MNAIQKPVTLAVAEAIDVTPVAIVKHDKARVTIARPMSADELEAYEIGETLALHTIDGTMHLEDALRACKSVKRRAALRAGFAAVWSAARGITIESAERKFNRMAQELTPETSRKAKANAKRKAGGGRKVKAKGGKVDKTDRAPQILVAALQWCAKQQRRHAGDDDVMELLGELAAILADRKAKGRK